MYEKRIGLYSHNPTQAFSRFIFVVDFIHAAVAVICYSSNSSTFRVIKIEFAVVYAEHFILLKLSI